MKKLKFFVLLMLLAIAAGNVCAANTGVSQAEDMYRQGLKAEGAGDDERAIHIYETIADRYRDSDYATKALEKATTLKKEQQAKKEALISSVAIQCKVSVQECLKYGEPNRSICLSYHPECEGLRKAGRLY